MYCNRCGTWAPDAAPSCPRCGETLTPQAQAPARAELPPAQAGPEADAAAAPAAPAPRYAGFWRRAGAMLVDWLLLFFPDAILRVMLGLPTAFTLQAPRDEQTGPLLTAIAISTGVWWLYCALLESSRWRGTLGQQLLGMRVGDREGRRISFGRASGRYFAQFLSAMLCGLGYLFNLWTARRQTLHDMVAGCVFTVSGSRAVPDGAADAERVS